MLRLKFTELSAGQGFLKVSMNRRLPGSCSSVDYPSSDKNRYRYTIKDKTLATPLRIDLLVDNIVIVERKATTDYNPIYEAQALTYLRVTGLCIALVINFGERLVKRGIHRVINNAA
jgi:GxxExxY protein